jgi:hypothetical protein
MKNIKTAFFLTLLSITLNACGQSIEKRTILGKSYAEQELKSALTDKSQHTIIENKTEPIKDSLTAIKIVDPILFRIYGKKNIVQQRPYEIYLIDNYWVIIGTLPVDTEGGTFLIIMDSYQTTKQSKTIMKKGIIIFGIVGLAIVGGLNAKRKFYNPQNRLENSKTIVKQPAEKDEIKNGDLIFQSSLSGQSQAIQLAKNS